MNIQFLDWVQINETMLLPHNRWGREHEGFMVRSYPTEDAA